MATDLKEEILGYVNGMCVVDECEILNLFVKEPWRRQGIGRKLCNDFISKSKVYGCQKIFLEVRAANSAARLLYKQLDFEDNNIRKKYYDDGEDAVVMVNFLKRRTL